MAAKHQDVIITGGFLCVILDCVYKRLSDIGVRGHFSVCTMAEKCALHPNAYIASGGGGNQHFQYCISYIWILWRSHRFHRCVMKCCYAYVLKLDMSCVHHENEEVFS